VNAPQAKRDFDARNGHIEMDVDFQHERIALTGTSTNITLLSFAGEELVHLENAMPDRNACIEFSPSGDRLIVGCFDGTVAVFKLPTLPEPAKPSLTGKPDGRGG
jgi:WD40 repeat protein